MPLKKMGADSSGSSGKSDSFAQNDYSRHNPGKANVKEFSGQLTRIFCRNNELPWKKFSINFRVFRL
jgi:hypothetical protein